MSRLILALPLLIVACGGEISIGDLDTDTDADTEPDWSMYEGASLRIVQPASASFLPLGETHRFQAEVYAADGTVLDEDFDVTWDSSVDPQWTPDGLSFDDATIDVGIHDLTAEVELPNGNRLAHTVGGVLVQAEAAGTYVGTLSGGTTIQQVPVSCAGGAVLIVDPYGEVVDGTAECLIRLNNFELPLDFTVESTLDQGAVDGDVTAEVFSFPIAFPTEGTLAGEDLDLAFKGTIIANEFTGDIHTTRISRDAGL